MPVKNEIGNKYGRLTVIERSENNGQGDAMWKCQCDCGNIIITKGASLRAGRTQSCGCGRKIDSKTVINEIGNRYGSFIVLERAENEGRKATWLCQCDCGNKVIVRGDSLRSGKTKSCGCSYKIEMIGKRFGKLTVIAREGLDGKHATWLCECDCGNQIVATGNHLRTGHTQSCGCIKSRGELVISQLLNEFGAVFKKEYTFDDLRNKSGNKLRFDFAIFKDNQLTHLIEFDGPQHYEENHAYYSETMVEHDALKNAYCRSNNIKLIRLRGYENLTIEDLEVI